MQDSTPGSYQGTISTRWAHPSVILVATSLDDLDHLMPFAQAQARQNQARLILLHVLRNQASIAHTDQAVLPFYDPSAAMEAASRTLEGYCEKAQLQDVDCHALLREGSIVQQIAAVARQFNADRLLIGTRGRGKLGKLLLGSVAEQVLRSVNLPVITVGPEAHLQVDQEGCQPVVLHATTLRETSRPGAALACQVASCQGARLVLLHVLPPVDEMERKGLPTGLQSAAMHELQRMAQETVGACGIAVEAQVVHGNPHIEILAQAAERKAALIVLGAGSRNPLESLTRDRVALRVLAHARCPVMSLLDSASHSEPLPVDSMAFHQ